MGQPLPSPADNRRYERTQIAMPGQLFDPVSQQSVECTIRNLSAGGAALDCPLTFAQGAPLVLYAENFGRFEGTAIVHGEGQLALQFSIEENRRDSLVHVLKSFALHGVVKAMKLRRHARVPTLVSGSIVRANGELLTCDVLDISQEGVSVRTSVRPPVGEIVNLGRTRGRVVRHHDDGIAIQYVRDASIAA